MKPVYQTILSPPHGNCFQACVASLLELPLEEVPNVMEWPVETWGDRFANWLYDRGFGWLHGVHFEDPEACPLVYHIIVGKSPRGNMNHSVVGFGGKVVHDPFPGGEGIKEELFHEYFVPIDPKKIKGDEMSEIERIKTAERLAYLKERATHDTPGPQVILELANEVSESWKERDIVTGLLREIVEAYKDEACKTSDLIIPPESTIGRAEKLLAGHKG